MIDWLTIHVSAPHDLASVEGDLYLTLDRDGAVKRRFRAGRHLEGSWSSVVRVSTVALTPCGTRGATLRIDGNPAKWLQGHNIAGPHSVDFLLEFVQSVVSAIGAEPITQAAWLSAEVYRLDLTNSWDLGCESKVLDWIHAAERQVTLSHRGHGNLSKGSTVYWGKNSRRWSIKCYPKGRELQAAKRRPRLGPDTLKAIEYAKRLLRIEIVLRRPHLEKMKRSTIADLSDDEIEKMYTEHLEKLTISDRIRMRYEDFDDLTPSQRLAVQAWADGHRLRELLSCSSYYRLRRKILDQGGPDLASPAPVGGDVVPLLRPLEAKPAIVPDWLLTHCWSRSRSSGVKLRVIS